MIAIIDNYDSFTYNLYQYFGQLGCRVRVFRNDEISVQGLAELPLSHLVVSPGPGRPEHAGISCQAIAYFQERLPILGICLGHQSIVEVFGGDVIHCRAPIHGKTAQVYHQGSSVFRDLPNPLEAARYHSLAVRPETLPSCLRVLAETEEGDIMAVVHEKQPIVGLQFHPESIFTQNGLELLQNFLTISRQGGAVRVG